MARISKDRAISLLGRALVRTGMFSPGAVDYVVSGQADESAIDAALEQAKIDLNPGEHKVKDEYVLGFVFDNEFKHVLLVWKSHPTWQAGLLNGVGGSVEEGETPLMAMKREFLEETGIDNEILHWMHVGHMMRPALYDNQDYSFKMHIFVGRLPLEYMKAAHDHATDEEPIALPLNMEIIKRRGVQNLTWLVDAALNSFKTAILIKAEYPPYYPEENA